MYAESLIFSGSLPDTGWTSRSPIWVTKSHRQIIWRKAYKIIMFLDIFWPTFFHGKYFSIFDAFCGWIGRALIYFRVKKVKWFGNLLVFNIFRLAPLSMNHLLPSLFVQTLKDYDVFLCVYYTLGFGLFLPDLSLKTITFQICYMDNSFSCLNFTHPQFFVHNLLIPVFFFLKRIRTSNFASQFLSVHCWEIVNKSKENHWLGKSGVSLKARPIFPTWFDYVEESFS